MASHPEIALESYYSYGHRGRAMTAVRAPFAMRGDAPEIVGRTVRIDGVAHLVLAVSRQISGPIAKGEPIGVETRALDPAAPAP